MKGMQILAIAVHAPELEEDVCRVTAEKIEYQSLTREMISVLEDCLLSCNLQDGVLDLGRACSISARSRKGEDG